MSRERTWMPHCAGLRTRLARRGAVLLLVVAGLLQPATAFAQQDPYKRLEMFRNNNGVLYNRTSDDGGTTWSGWYMVPNNLVGGTALSFVGAPAVVADQDGRFWITAKTTTGLIVYNMYSSATWSWQFWKIVPGSEPGRVCVIDPSFLHRSGLCGAEDEDTAYYLRPDGDPALSSWGPGRLELFFNMRREDGFIALMHTWADNGAWSGKWEELGTGQMQGSPAAVSWAPGRTDVFVRGGGNELAHKWFANGSWSSGWDHLAAYMTSSPSVASVRPGHLDVFARGIDGALWHQWYQSGWSNWESMGGLLGTAPGNTLSAVSRGSNNIDVFVPGSDQVSVFQRTCCYWGDFRLVDGGVAQHTTTLYWVPGKRLETLENLNGVLYHRWSYDGGSSWAPWMPVPSYDAGEFLLYYTFVGTPSLVSDTPGSLRVVARTHFGTLVDNVYQTRKNAWRGWKQIPGIYDAASGLGGVGIGWGFNYVVEPDYYFWRNLPDSYPAIASWGPGRLELFMHALRESDGAKVLLHTWGDNGVWSGTWELLGTGKMQGSPTAVSWGPGRTDVFVRGGGNELAHKWFANGSWSSGWESLGGCMTSSPSVATPDAGWLDVYARGCEGALWHRPYGPSGWDNWAYQDSLLGAGAGNTVAAASKGPGFVDVFVFGADNVTLLQRAYAWFSGWSPFTNRGSFGQYVAAAYWIS